MRPILAVLAFLPLILTPRVFAEEVDRVTVLRGFFVEVAAKKYGDAWKDFTKKTQDGIIDSISKDEKMSRDEVSKLFKDNSPRIQDGFWEGFRKSSKAEVFSGVPMEAANASGADGGVAVTLPGGRKVVLSMFKESGLWKVGWLETFFPKGVTIPPKKK